MQQLAKMYSQLQSLLESYCKTCDDYGSEKTEQLVKVQR